MSNQQECLRLRGIICRCHGMGCNACMCPYSFRTKGVLFMQDENVRNARLTEIDWFVGKAVAYIGNDVMLPLTLDPTYRTWSEALSSVPQVGCWQADAGGAGLCINSLEPPVTLQRVSGPICWLCINLGRI